ncbi:Hypothetical predicted protein, partial [Scomber scombrus]
KKSAFACRAAGTKPSEINKAGAREMTEGNGGEREEENGGERLKMREKERCEAECKKF